MFLVDREMRPAPRVFDVLDAAADPRLTTELGRFQIEANIGPQLLAGTGLRRLEDELRDAVDAVRAAAAACDAEVLLAGALPTLRRADLGPEALTPLTRYHELAAVLRALRGEDFRIHIKGLDEVTTTLGSLLLEAACTSFQVHFQVDPDEFATQYNVAQAVAGAVLAPAVNSPLLFGQRLWHETRIALFQHAVDERSPARQARGSAPRVSFGDDWLQRSVVEIHRDDLARFRVLLAKDAGPDALDELDAGRVRALAALALHNGTIWRWNRPCYGVLHGRASLRIENRYLPSGPTVIDEMATAALWVGLMGAFVPEYGSPRSVLSFDDVKANFFAAARHGLDATLHWVGNRQLTAVDLLLGELLPLARHGLRALDVDGDVIDRYLDLVEERVRSRRTAAQWLLVSRRQIDRSVRPAGRDRALTAAMLARQKSEQPVARWELCDATADSGDNNGVDVDPAADARYVWQLMTADVFTVGPDEPIELAANVMAWKHIRHVPVEDRAGRLLGLVSARDLIRAVASGRTDAAPTPLTAGAVMTPDPVTTSPECSTVEAMRLMRLHGVGCLPVLEDDAVVGIITATDLLDVATVLLERELGGRVPAANGRQEGLSGDRAQP